MESAGRPSVLEAAVSVPRAKDSLVSTAERDLGSRTAVVAVMITLPAAKLIVTWELSTPAAVAIFCCKLEVSE